jgi:hypothetical protein
VIHDPPDPEEARLLKIVTECSEAVATRRAALTAPDHLVQRVEYRALAGEFEAARVKSKEAIEALREYRKGRGSNGSI